MDQIFIKASTLNLHSYNISKEDLDDIKYVITSLFTSNDIFVNNYRLSSENVKEFNYEKYYFENDNAEILIKADIGIIIDRLNVLGYNIEYSIRSCFSYIGCDDLPKDFSNHNFVFNEDVSDEQIRVSDALSSIKLRNFTVSDFTHAVLQILNIEPIDSKNLLTGFLQKYVGKESKFLTSLSGVFIDIKRYNVKDSNLILSLIRVVGEIIKDRHIEISCDITDNADQFVGIFSDALTWSNNEKILVFTEGISDAKIIRQSIDKIYPHLSHIYKLIDYKSASVKGGTSTMVLLAKSLITSGIIQKCIFIFDNDTAGHDAIQNINQINHIAENFAILHYPSLEDFQHYPTIGPNGPEAMNINGLACSIEMYLGKDIINRTPIQWTGYNKKMERYQGEIILKGRVQKQYEIKLKNYDPSNEDQDWYAMTQLLQTMINAY